jgi:serine protease SohB
MHWADLSNYLFFLLKSMTVVISILIVVSVTIILATRSKSNLKNKLLIKNLNKKYTKHQKLLQQECLDKLEKKALKKTTQKKTKRQDTSKKRLFVLDFKGDMQASTVMALAEAINAILLIATPHTDEVLLRLENQGGTIHGHGLAAAQLRRLRDANIYLTIAVDKVAASGGYLMASLANHLIASPFAIIGSIGVLVQLPNFHQLLKKKSIDFEQITAGQYKRTLSVFGKNTKEGREKMQAEVDTIHDLFKQYVKSNRPQVDLAKVATGEFWLGDKALSLKLVDELKLSDDFIMDKRVSHHIYQLSYTLKKPLLARLRQGTETLLYQLFQRDNQNTTYF